ncbi:hypothetical protein GmHk_04G010812 [Glycine max]|nr:hypothetical protein GmHk_04G010812 [Glycine max]
MQKFLQLCDKVAGLFVRVNCTLSGKVSLHSGDINALSNLLLDSPFGLNQVYCLPTFGTSNNSMSSIHSLNSCILLSPTDLSIFPILSFGFLMQASLVQTPSKRMNPVPVTLFCSLKSDSVHMHKMPPAELIAGCISHITSSLPHIA